MEWEASMKNGNTKEKCMMKEQRDELSRGCLHIPWNKVISLQKVSLKSCLIPFFFLILPLLFHPNHCLQVHCSINHLEPVTKSKASAERPPHSGETVLDPLWASIGFPTSPGRGPWENPLSRRRFASSHSQPLSLHFYNRKKKTPWNNLTG